jgi:4-hydroxyphenylpyruvate dioxygenase
MHKSIATVSVGGTLEEKLQAISAAKFDGIELFDNDLISSPLLPSDVAKRCADLGLSIDLFQPARDLAAVAPESCGNVLRYFEHKLDVMEGLEAPTVLMYSNATPEAIADPDLSAEQLHALGDLAQERGIVIAFEALAWGTHVNRLSHAWNIIRRTDHPSVGLAVDTFHLLARGDDTSALNEIPANRIAFLHVADAPHLLMDVLESSQHFRCFPGQGSLDVARVVDAVVSAGYRGPVSAAVFSDVVREAPAAKTAMDAMRSLLYLEEQLRVRWDSLHPPEAPRPQVVLFDPPPAPPSVDAAFVEVAVRPDDKDFTSLLGRLGFRHAGTHRTKPVTWWRNGGANLILDASSDLSDHRAAALHRPAVTALCLQAAGVADLATRSAALMWPSVRRRRGAGEAMLPGLSTPSGTHVFITAPDGNADDWHNDFIPVPAEAEGPDEGDWLGIDHIGMIVDPGQYDEEVSFYRTLFGLTSGPVSEFLDPQGRLRSRVLRPAQGDLRVVLNVTSAGHSVPTQTGVNQLAFACDDVFAAVARLRSRGVDLLDIPDNYYVDVRARFDLDPKFVGRLRESGILYDRTDRGEFLHVYSQQIKGRFYVELLQRIGDYDGYGAPNTFIRLAAQAVAKRPSS